MESSDAPDRLKVFSLNEAPRKVIALSIDDLTSHELFIQESSCLGLQLQSGGKFSPKAKYQQETDSEQVNEVRGGQTSRAFIALPPVLQEKDTRQSRVERDSGQYSGARRVDRMLLPFYWRDGGRGEGGRWATAFSFSLSSCPFGREGPSGIHMAATLNRPMGYCP